MANGNGQRMACYCYGYTPPNPVPLWNITVTIRTLLVLGTLESVILSWSLIARETNYKLLGVVHVVVIFMLANLHFVLINRHAQAGFSQDSNGRHLLHSTKAKSLNGAASCLKRQLKFQMGGINHNRTSR